MPFRTHASGLMDVTGSALCATNVPTSPSEFPWLLGQLCEEGRSEEDSWLPRGVLRHIQNAAFRELRGSNSGGWAAIDHSFRINGFEQLTQEYLDHSDDHQSADGTFTDLPLRLEHRFIRFTRGHQI
jgi:hypothetical protein